MPRPGGEFPFGELKRVQRHFSKWWDATDDTSANRNPYAIVFERDEAWDPEPNAYGSGRNRAAAEEKSG